MGATTGGGWARAGTAPNADTTASRPPQTHDRGRRITCAKARSMPARATQVSDTIQQIGGPRRVAPRFRENGGARIFHPSSYHAPHGGTRFPSTETTGHARAWLLPRL